MRPTQPPVQFMIRVLSLGVKQPEREADHWPPPNAKYKNEWSNISAASPTTSHFVCMELTEVTLPHYRWLNVPDVCACCYCVMLYQLLSLRDNEWWADRICIYTYRTVLGALAVGCGQMQKTNQLLVCIRSGCLMTVSCSLLVCCQCCAIAGVLYAAAVETSSM